MIEDVIRLAFKTVLRTFLLVENRPLEVLIHECVGKNVLINVVN